MVYSRDKNLMGYAMKMGCKTAGQFASFLRVRKAVMKLDKCFEEI